MNKLTVRYRILMGYVFPVLVFVMMGFFANYQLQQVQSAFKDAEANHDLLTLNAQIQKALLDTETGVRGYLLTGQESFLDPYRSGTQKVEELIEEASRRLQGDPSATEGWRVIRQEYESKLKPWQENIVRQRHGDRGAELVMPEFTRGTDKQYMDDLRQKINRIADARLEKVKAAQLYAEQAGQRAFWSIVLCLGIGIVLALGGGLAIAQGIGSTLTQSTHSIASFASELAATAEEQERTLKAQVVSVSETSTTMEELEASFQHSLKAAETSADFARNAASVARDGNQRVDQAASTMSGIQESVTGIAAQITQLSEQVSQIGTITTLVGDLANRTHLLAVNASVEAARAGEHGRGFGVVALEIRKLADQSKTSAEKIGVLVNDIQRSTNGAVMAAESGIRAARDGQSAAHGAGDAFRQLSGALDATLESAQQAALNVAQQSAAVRQVVTAIESLNHGAQQTSAGLSQTYVGIRRLRETSEKLAEMV